MSAQSSKRPGSRGAGRFNRGKSPLRALAFRERPEDIRGTTRRLLRYLAPFRTRIAYGMFWVLVSSTATALAPRLTGAIVDAAVGAHGDARVLTVPALLLVATYIVGWWGDRSQILALATIGQRTLLVVRQDIFEKVLDLSVAFFDRVESGDLMSRLVNDVETLNSFFGNTFRRIFGASISLAATLVGMLLLDWRLALATLAVVPVMLGVTRVFSMWARRAYRLSREAIGDVSSTLAEDLAGVRAAQAFSRTEATVTEFAERNAANRDANVAAATVSSAFSPALALIAAFATAAVAALGGWLMFRDVVTIGVIVAFFAYARQLFSGVSQISSVYADTQSAIAGGERVLALLDMPAEVTDADSATEIGRADGRIDFEDVSFAYGDGPEVLHGIDLHIEPGTTVAIVGPTGAGKSTIINLVARFYDPSRGAVRLDGRDLRDITMRSLRRNLGIVLQEPFLFSGTIAENIRYGRLDASDEDVHRAAEMARALAVVERLPEGLDTPVGERGALLSTGQRQLIAFARAILADPAVLILDEATSSVDTRTELLIQHALRSVLADRTAIVIAHRLSTVRDADRILFVDSGRIVEDGSYAELLAAGGAFARLHGAQFSA